MSGLTAKIPPVGQTILIRDLEIPFVIGIHDHEQRAPQRVLISIEMFLADADKTPKDLSETVDYSAIVAQVKALAVGGHIALVETLADHIHMILAAEPLLAGAAVVIEKPDIIQEAAAVGVRSIRYYRPDERG